MQCSKYHAKWQVLVPLLQIQGKWYRERKPKKHSKTWGKTKIQKLFYTRFLIMGNEFIKNPSSSACFFFKHIHHYFVHVWNSSKNAKTVKIAWKNPCLFAARQVAVRLHKATGGRSFWGFKLRNITSRLTTAIIHVWSYMHAYIYIYRTITYYNYIYIYIVYMYGKKERERDAPPPHTHTQNIYIYSHTHTWMYITCMIPCVNV